jgi:hypothetical protein
LDQHRLAQVAGVSQATVSWAMAGHRVHRATMLRLAAALKRQQPIPELQLLLDVDECEGRGPLPQPQQVQRPNPTVQNERRERRSGA